MLIQIGINLTELWIILLIELYIPLSWFWLTHYICSRCWSSHLLPPEPGLSWNTCLFIYILFPNNFSKPLIYQYLCIQRTS